MQIARSVAAALVLLGCGSKQQEAAREAPAAPSRDDAADRAAAREDAAGDPAAAVPAPPPLPAPPAGLADADLIAIDGGELVAYRIADGAVARLGAATLRAGEPDDPTAWLSGDWADRDTFFAYVPPRTVLQVTASAIGEVAVPPPETFRAPRPQGSTTTRGSPRAA